MRDCHRVDDRIVVLLAQLLEAIEKIAQVHIVRHIGDRAADDDCVHEAHDLNVRLRNGNAQHLRESVQDLVRDAHFIRITGAAGPRENRGVTRVLCVDDELARTDRNDAGDVGVAHGHAREAGEPQDYRVPAFQNNRVGRGARQGARSERESN